MNIRIVNALESCMGTINNACQRLSFFLPAYYFIYPGAVIFLYLLFASVVLTTSSLLFIIFSLALVLVGVIDLTLRWRKCTLSDPGRCEKMVFSPDFKAKIKDEMLSEMPNPSPGVSRDFQENKSSVFSSPYTSENKYTDSLLNTSDFESLKFQCQKCDISVYGSDPNVYIRHCRYCQKCVLNFDHHCPWIGNCIGPNNLGLFIDFLSRATFLLFTAAFLALVALFIPGKKGWIGSTWGSFEKTITKLFGLFALVGFSIFLCCFTSFYKEAEENEMGGRMYKSYLKKKKERQCDEAIA